MRSVMVSCTPGDRVNGVVLRRLTSLDEMEDFTVAVI